MENVLVAEINYSREASSEEYRRLGEALEECRQANDWIAAIGGLDELLRGECPREVFSKWIGNSKTGEITPIGFPTPILVWGLLDYPGSERINPMEILRAAIQSTIGQVTYPDPDGGI
jgi:hypothetical protein